MEVEPDAQPKSRLNKMMSVFCNKYWLLLLFQILVLVLFLYFCKHGYKPEHDEYGLKGFEDTHVMIFIGFGFLMTFLKKYAYSSLGFNFLLAAFAAQWALFNQQVYTMTAGNIMITKKVLIEADIAAATVLITFGALLGWTSALQLIIVTFFECIFFGLNFYIVGHLLKAADIGGSICIHSFGAYFGLGCSFALRLKKYRQSSSESGVLENLNGSSYISDVTAMLGTLFLFTYWPSFNSALTNSHFEYQRAVTNTYLSLMACVVTSYCMSSFVAQDNRFDMVHIQNAPLAGGVAIGAVCNMQVAPGIAILIGCIAGIISVVGYKWITPKLEKCGFNDTCGVHNLHGLPGVFSGLVSIIVAWIAAEENYPDGQYYDIFPAISGGNNASKQALAQLYGLLVTIGLSLCGGAVTGFIARYFGKSDKLDEKEKYDDAVNWELPAP